MNNLSVSNSKIQKIPFRSQDNITVNKADLLTINNYGKTGAVTGTAIGITGSLIAREQKISTLFRLGSKLNEFKNSTGLNKFISKFVSKIGDVVNHDFTRVYDALSTESLDKSKKLIANVIRRNTRFDIVKSGAIGLIAGALIGVGIAFNKIVNKPESKIK